MTLPDYTIHYILTPIYTLVLIISIIFFTQKKNQKILLYLLLPVSIFLLILAMINFSFYLDGFEFDIFGIERVYWVVASLVSVLLLGVILMNKRKHETSATPSGGE